MLTKDTLLRRVLPLLAGVSSVGGMGYLARRFLKQPLPQLQGALTVQGLRRPVEIVRDRWGVPHVYAQTEEDLFFGQGFAQAQDRLFQMDVNWRVGMGRIGEVVGPPGLPSDRFARVFGWHRAAEAQVAGIESDPETRAVADSFAAGVNAFMALGKLPVEFTLLAYKPEPWRPLYSAAWGTVLAWGLSVNWETELVRAQLIEKLGPERAADLTPAYRDPYPTILPDTAIGDRLANAMLNAYHQAVATLPLGHVPTGAGVGSNNWVVNGQRTESGRPILANDPHLPPIFPTLWYENHLVGGRYNVTGFTTPGVPGVIIGHNEAIAWGVTNAFPDIQDIYVERFHADDPLLYEVNGEWVQAEQRIETICVRGRRRPVVERVRYTRHGPLISELIAGEHRDLALRWSCYGQNNHLRAMLGMARAGDWDSFRKALQDWAFPPQNVVYADVRGNVGYVMPGRVPLRPGKDEGLVPVPGWDDGHEWLGWIPPDELPQCCNPPQGYIVTANNHVAGDDYPHLLSGEWLPPYLAQRITALIEEMTPLTIADNGIIQNDTVSLLMRRFLSLALPLLPGAPVSPHSQQARALQHLQSWNGDMDADQVAPAIAHGWLVCFTRAALAQALGAELAEELLGREGPEEFRGNSFHEIAYELALRWLAHGTPQWVEDVRRLLQQTLQQALAILETTLGRDPDGWRWGLLHYVKIESHLARIPGLGRLWKPLTYPLDGDGFTVNQADIGPHFPPEPVHIIASCRMILDVGAWDNSVSALPGGQSAHLASKHYQDHVEDWRHGRYHPMLFSREQIEAAAEGILRLRPEDEHHETTEDPGAG